MLQKLDMWLVETEQRHRGHNLKYFSEWIEMMKDIDC